MKKVFLSLFLACCLQSVPAVAQQAPGSLYGLPPEYVEQMKKMMPPGMQFPGMGGTAVDKASDEPKPLIAMPPFQEPQYRSEPSSGIRSPYGSGRTPEQRAAAVAGINLELDRLPYILPEKDAAPTKSEILKLAADINADAKKKFKALEISAYAETVTWMPYFDARHTDPKKAAEYSLLVSLATNYFTTPHYIAALSTAVFSLDPDSTVNANNLATAIVTAGERAGSDPKALSLARNQAEAVYMYTLATSMEGGAWQEKSFLALLNLGHLYIDMGRLDEACSLFRVARKMKPRSWDAARGLAAYFMAKGQRAKALAVLEDDNLDRPAMYVVAKKAAKMLEKSDPYGDIPMDADEERYQEGIKVMNSEPVATAADFVAQLDQSERNKIRYFVEHLAPQGSFKAPSIIKVSQYASAKAISSPQGVSGLKEFAEMVGMFDVSAAVTIVKTQMEFLSRMGMNIDLGADIDDMARHPEKYQGKKRKVKVTGKERLKANMQALADQAKTAKAETQGGHHSSLTGMVGMIDPYFKIIQIDPNKYADPMNVVIQKYNFVVHNRKTSLYNGYLYTVNKRTHNAVEEEIRRTWEKVRPLAAQRNAALEELEKELQGAKDAESELKRHAIHSEYFEKKNNIIQVGYGNATNVVSVAYVQKIKPTVEAYYYDVIRHVALISDPEIRKQKDQELRSKINQALMWALRTVLVAHASFPHDDDWDCDCDVDALLRQREAEQAAKDAAENERIMRNKEAKARFDSGEIPESTPLFKKLDAMGTDLNIPFIPFLKGRISCARTVVELNTDVLPFPGISTLFGKMTRSENTGAAKYEGGIAFGISGKAGGAEIEASLGLSGSVSMDGKGTVSDYEVTPSTGLSVGAGNAKVGIEGSMTVGRGSDGSMTVREVSAGASYTKTYPSSEVKVSGNMTFSSSGDSDFSAGIEQDVKNGFGTTGKGSLEASTQRGCTLSGSVTNSIMPADADGQYVDKSAFEEIQGDGIKDHFGESFREKPVTDQFHKKELWSGSFTL